VEFAMVRAVVRDDDFTPVLYARLGVEPDASDDEIRKAYKVQAQRTHPDRFPEKEAEFVAAGRAYEVLSKIRSTYDRELKARGYTFTYETGPKEGQTTDNFGSKKSKTFNATASSSDYQRFKDAFG